jgi:DNA polymerase-3 subunit epsilon
MQPASIATTAAPPQYYVSIDLETTGLDPHTNGICQIGACVFNASGELVTVFVSDCCPSSDFINEEAVYPFMPEHVIVVTKEALELNGFTLERIYDAPGIGYVLQKFLNWLKPYSGQTPIAVFHNAPFDVGFLKRSFARAGIDPGRLLRRVRDTATMSPDVYGEGNYPRSLEEICKREGIEKVNNHDGLHDALATGKAFFSLKAKLDDRRPGTVENLFFHFNKLNTGGFAT